MSGQVKWAMVGAHLHRLYLQTWVSAELGQSADNFARAYPWGSDCIDDRSKSLTAPSWV